METSWNQEFYREIEPIAMIDPLASALGALADDSPIYYSYIDCVKLAGHACPSVSAAFQMTKLALKELFQEQVPVRGEIEVIYLGERTEGANGPIGQVIQYLTGAAIETGFHGLGGAYQRANLFQFQPGSEQMSGINVIFSRSDSGLAVQLSANLSLVPTSSQEREYAQLMPKVIQNMATIEERERFYLFWQGKNRKILLEEHPGVFKITHLS
jgi:formylmethanofuran dehydrogenase subunit E